MQFDHLLDDFRRKPLVGYHVRTKPSSEPIAWVSMALSTVGDLESAREGANWLARLQANDGSVGVRLGEPEPKWPTSLAVLTWLTWQSVAGRDPFQQNIDRAVQWITSNEGKTQPRDPQTGHDTTLAGWSWAENTHSWVEPTAMNVLALRAAGLHDSPRTRVGIALLLDRELASGGANYGNTTVLGQELRPHVMPTALTLLALSAESVHPKTRHSLDYLIKTVHGNYAAASLGLSVLALTAYQRVPPTASQWLAEAAERVARRDNAPYKKAILCHADLGARSPVVLLPQRKVATPVSVRQPS
jgi:hypothetical protein